MRSVFYKFINFWPTESGEVASKPKPQKMFTPRFKDGGQRSDARKIHLACWFVHILSTWALNRLRLDTMEFNCLPEEMLGRAANRSPQDFGLMKANCRVFDRKTLPALFLRKCTCRSSWVRHISNIPDTRSVTLTWPTHLKRRTDTVDFIPQAGTPTATTEKENLIKKTTGSEDNLWIISLLKSEGQC